MSSSRPPSPNETADHRAGRKMTSGLAALSSACVLVVYSAGYLRTKAAADRLAEADTHRRPNTEPVGRVPANPAVAAPAADSAVTFTLPTRPAPRPDQVGESRPAIIPSPTPPAGATAASTPVDNTGPAAAATEPATPTAGPVTPSADPNPPPAAPPAAAPAPAASNTAPTIDPPAAAAPSTTVATPAAAPALYKDGTYLGWGTCRHGDIQASVTIAGGRIVSAAIAQCWTRYTCNWLDPVVPQVVTRQSPNVDYVSGATQSTDAFYWAVVDALSKAK